MKRYAIRALVRKKGAIGKFTWKIETVEAENEEQARELIFQKWEVNAISGIAELTA